MLTSADLKASRSLDEANDVRFLGEDVPFARGRDGFGNGDARSVVLSTDGSQVRVRTLLEDNNMPD